MSSSAGKGTYAGLSIRIGARPHANLHGPVAEVRWNPTESLQFHRAATPPSLTQTSSLFLNDQDTPRLCRFCSPCWQKARINRNSGPPTGCFRAKPSSHSWFPSHEASKMGQGAFERSASLHRLCPRGTNKWQKDFMTLVTLQSTTSDNAHPPRLSTPPSRKSSAKRCRAGQAAAGQSWTTLADGETFIKNLPPPPNKATRLVLVFTPVLVLPVGFLEEP